jgi:hypothetical protein
MEFTVAVKRSREAVDKAAATTRERWFSGIDFGAAYGHA